MNFFSPQQALNFWRVSRIYEVINGDKDEVREQKELILHAYQDAITLFTEVKYFSRLSSHLKPTTHS